MEANRRKLGNVKTKAAANPEAFLIATVMAPSASDLAREV
jgi:hypothetical protein